MGRETGRKENSEDLGRKPVGKKRNKKKKEIIRNHQLSLPMAKVEEMASASKMLGDAALICLLPGLEQTSFQCWDFYVTTASGFLLVVYRNRDLLQFLSPVNQLHSLSVPFLVN